MYIYVDLLPLVDEWDADGSCGTLPHSPQAKQAARKAPLVSLLSSALVYVHVSSFLWCTDAQSLSPSPCFPFQLTSALNDELKLVKSERLMTELHRHNDG